MAYYRGAGEGLYGRTRVRTRVRTHSWTDPSPAQGGPRGRAGGGQQLYAATTVVLPMHGPAVCSLSSAVHTHTRDAPVRAHRRSLPAGVHTCAGVLPVLPLQPPVCDVVPAHHKGLRPFRSSTGQDVHRPGTAVSDGSAPLPSPHTHTRTRTHAAHGATLLPAHPPTHRCPPLCTRHSARVAHVRAA